MDITIIESDVIDQTTFKTGMSLVKSYISDFFNLKYKSSDFLFTSIPFSIPTLNGYEIDPNEIIAQTDKTEDTVFLIFDAKKVSPSPLNPMCTVEQGEKPGICQMCEQWYQNSPETFAQFFLHEICHRIFFALGQEDITHLLTDGILQAKYATLYLQFNTKPAIDYYVYIINSLMPAWKQYKAGQNTMELHTDSTGSDVITLQNNLKSFGYELEADGIFGRGTYQAVVDFQTNHSLEADGIVGPLTQEALKTGLNALISPVEPPIAPEMAQTVSSTTTHPKIDIWCEATKEFEGAKPELNNPGNIKFEDQEFSTDEDGFCKFDTYEHGYQALYTLIFNACSGKSRIYNSSGTLLDFYNVYAPATDNNVPINYATFVANKLDVGVDTIISSLL